MLIICGVFDELRLSYSRGMRSASSDVFSTPLQRVVVAADECRRNHLLWQHCIRGVTARQCRLTGRAQMLETVESIWCADHRSRHQCVAEQPSCAPTFTTVYYCSSLLFGGNRADVGQCRLVRRAVQCRPSTSLLVHGGAAADCSKVAYDVPVLAVVEWRTARRCRTMSTRRGARCSVDHRPRRPCAVAPPSCAPRLPTMYQCSLLLFGGTRADVGQCRLVETRDAVSTSDLAVSVRRFRGTIEMHDCTYGCIK
jgi:hypothetical protein